MGTGRQRGDLWVGKVCGVGTPKYLHLCTGYGAVSRRSLKETTLLSQRLCRPSSCQGESVT